MQNFHPSSTLQSQITVVMEMHSSKLNGFLLHDAELETELILATLQDI